MTYTIKVQETDGYLIRQVEAKSPQAALARMQVLFPTYQVKLCDTLVSPPTPPHIPSQR